MTSHNGEPVVKCVKLTKRYGEFTALDVPEVDHGFAPSRMRATMALVRVAHVTSAPARMIQAVA